MRQKIIFFLLGVLICFSLTKAYAYLEYKGKIYSGYTVVLNGETLSGVVYLNDKASSQLIILYPYSNKAYLYGSNGASRHFVDEIFEFLSDPKSGILDAIVAKIKPTENNP